MDSNSIELEVRSILYDRVKPCHQCKVRFKTPIRCKKEIPEVWLPLEAVPLPAVIEYTQRLIQIPACRRDYSIPERIFALLAVSKEEELNSLLNEFRSVTGIQLPSSKKPEILTKLKNMIGKTCKVDQLLLIRRDILIEKIIDKRRTISVNIKKAEMQINLISDFKNPIKVTNEFDLEDFPSELTYINKTIPYSDDIPQEVMIGCNCQNCSSSCLHLNDEREFQKFDGKKGIEENHQEHPYDKDGRILYSHKKPVFECNNFCACDENCPRRVVQKGPNVQLEIFRTFNGCGWGVRTLEFVPKGTFVTRYAGELIKWEDGGARENKEYLFDNDIDIDQDVGHSTYTIDAFKFGNIARFVNHSCEPNLASHVVFINNMHPDLGEIVFFSRRDIEPYEELSINYIGLVKANKDKCRCAYCGNR